VIARLRGIIVEKEPNAAVVDVGGVGYALTIPISTFGSLPNVGDEATFHVHTHVREDALALFGFLTTTEREIFEKLISVNGVGPRLAVTVLSGLPTAGLLTAIRSADVNTSLTKIPGVGRKTGERIILELREKLGAMEGTSEGGVHSTMSGLERDVISAMVNLGCSADAASAAVKKAQEDGTGTEFEPLFRKALSLVRR
jgi:holliday junction DNA helicase RuvA